MILRRFWEGFGAWRGPGEPNTAKTQENIWFLFVFEGGQEQLTGDQSSENEQLTGDQPSENEPRSTRIKDS